MSGEFKQVDVLCPFYISSSQKARAISCEGFYSRSRLTMQFGRYVRAYRRHMAEFCCDNYHACEICKLINKKYY